MGWTSRPRFRSPKSEEARRWQSLLMKKAAVAIGTFLWIIAAFYIVYTSTARADSGNFILDTIDISGTTHLSVAGQNQLDAIVSYVSTNFGYTGTSAYFFDSDTVNPMTNTSGWSHGCGLNGTSLGGMTVSDSCIPAGGAEVPGHDTLYLCINILYNGATFFDLASNNVPVPCIQFNWNSSNGRYEGQSVANNPVDFSRVYFPVVYSSTSQAIPANSSLWESLSVASSTTHCDSGNILSDGFCNVMVYLFVPNPNITNQYAGLVSTSSPNSLSVRFPFSWMFGVKGLIDNTSASSSMNMVAPEIDFSSGISTTTPFGNFMPKLTIFSTSTIQQYLPAGMWQLIYFLMQCSLWLSLLYHIVAWVKSHSHKV